MNKEQWINEVYRLLCQSQGEPENQTEVVNIRNWAESIYDLAAEDAADLKMEIITPQDAYDEEMSCA